MNEITTQEAQKPTIVIPLKDLVEAYLQADDKVSMLEAELEPLQNAKKEIKAEIAKTLKERGEFSARTDKATVSLAVRKTAVIVDENALINDLKKQKLKQFIVPTVSDEFKKSLKTAEVANQIINGEKSYKGIEIKETEYPSVTRNKKDDARKIVSGDFVPLK